MVEVECMIRDGTYRREYARTIDELELDDSAKTRDGYIQMLATFDIETSTIEDVAKSLKKGYDCFQAYMYHWQMCINGDVYFGRTWVELQKFLCDVKDRAGLTVDRRLVVYVHNLSYEYYFLKSFFDMSEIFATDTRSVLKAVVDDVYELRCAYKLSNMSLDKFLINGIDVTHIKGKGDLDYRVRRTPKTELTLRELGYCYNDVKGLYEAVVEKLQDDTIKTIPLTSTGYVRRDCRIAMRKNTQNRREFKRNRLSYELYKLMQDATRGGNTASSRFYVDNILCNVTSKDIGSSYPFVMLTKKYPSGKFMKGDLKTEEELEYYNNKYCTVGRYFLSGVRLKKNVVIPYISFSKCQKCVNSKQYNGRVLSADYIVTSLTNVDYKILTAQYDYDTIAVEEYYYCRKDFLPAEIRGQIIQYYITKCRYKGNDLKKYEYQKDKGKLNSIYGMMVTNIIREPLYDYEGRFISELDIRKEQGEEIDNQEEEDIKRELLTQYYANRNNFLSYQWGIFVTAYAREHLQRAIDLCGMDLIYIDTDSVKYIGNYDAEFERLNEQIKKECEGIEHYVEIDGKRYYMGLFEDDGHYRRFRTLGAKKYCYEDDDGELHICVSGLNKAKGAAEIRRKGGIEHFREGEVFFDSGRTASQYNDEERHTIIVDGEEIDTGSNIAIFDVTYTLGISGTIKSFLDTRGVVCDY